MIEWEPRVGQGSIGTPEEAVVKRTSGVGPPADSSSQYTAPFTIYRLCIQFSCNFACMLICDLGYILWERCANFFIQKVIHLLFMVYSYTVLYTIYLLRSVCRWHFSMGLPSLFTCFYVIH